MQRSVLRHEVAVGGSEVRGRLVVEGDTFNVSVEHHIIRETKITGREKEKEQENLCFSSSADDV